MAEFTVLKQIDAWVNYETTVQANSAEEAAEYAREHESELEWTGGEAGDVQEYDHREFYTLDEEGSPIESTKLEGY